METDVDAKDKMIKENCDKLNSDTNKRNVHFVSMSKAVIIKNLLVVGVALMLQFSAFSSVANLQSSLNKAEGLGTTGLALLYGVMALTSLFLAPITVTRISTKWIMIWSMCTYIIYMTSGFYPSWYTVIPASIVIGIGSAHFWLAMPAYVIDIAERYAYITNTVKQDRVTLFLGIAYAAICTSHIWGNLFSSMVFQHEDSNSTLQDIGNFCGPSYCPYRELNTSLIVPPTEKQVYIYTGFCLGITVFAILLIGTFATNITPGSRLSTSYCSESRKVAVHLMTSREHQLLIIASVFGGLSMGFVVGDFTSAYVSCPYGIKNVGFVMITYGIAMSVCSVGFGKLYQYTGHIAIYTYGAITQVSVYVTLLLWTPLATQYLIVYVLAALSGIATAANEPVIAALHNLYFDKTRDIALSGYRLLNSIGWAISLGYSSWLCSQIKLYILIFVLVFSLITVIALDIKHRRCKSVNENDKSEEKVEEKLVEINN